jgi:hypothetical protein
MQHIRWLQDHGIAFGGGSFVVGVAVLVIQMTVVIAVDLHLVLASADTTPRPHLYRSG